MAVKSDEGVPLYIHTIYRILREMRMIQQELGGKFNYSEFKRQVMDSGLSTAQLGPLIQRFHTLESFMPRVQVDPRQIQFRVKGKDKGKGKEKPSGTGRSNWNLEVCII